MRLLDLEASGRAALRSASPSSASGSRSVTAGQARACVRILRGLGSRDVHALDLGRSSYAVAGFRPDGEHFHVVDLVKFLALVNLLLHRDEYDG